MAIKNSSFDLVRQFFVPAFLLCGSLCCDNTSTNRSLISSAPVEQATNVALEYKFLLGYAALIAAEQIHHNANGEVSRCWGRTFDIDKGFLETRISGIPGGSTCVLLEIQEKSSENKFTKHETTELSEAVLLEMCQALRDTCNSMYWGQDGVAKKTFAVILRSMDNDGRRKRLDVEIMAPKNGHNKYVAKCCRAEMFD